MSAVLTYNASTGSDSAASGSNAPTTAHTSTSKSATVSGTASTTTMTFSATIDLTGVNNDGTDVIYVAGTSGERHLFRITAFTGGVSTCTGLTVNESIGGSGLSTSAWAIGGKRQSFDNDTSRTDTVDWNDGWTVELEDTASFTHSTTCSITAGSLAGGKFILKNASGNSPVIATTGSIYGLEINSGAFIDVIGIKFVTETSRAGIRITTQSYLRCKDCWFDFNVTNGDGINIIDEATLVAENCYFEGGSFGADGVQPTGRSTIYIDSCFFDNGSNGISWSGANTYASLIVDNCVFYSQSNDGVIASSSSIYTLSIRNCAFVNAASDGINLSSNTARRSVYIRNCIFYGNTGYGINDASSTWKANSHLDFNAFGSNTAGDVVNVLKGPNTINLTADPFTNRTGKNFSLNTTTGGGDLLRAAGFPGTWKDGTNVGYGDVGPLQHQDTGGGGGGVVKLIGQGGGLIT